MSQFKYKLTTTRHIFSYADIRRVQFCIKIRLLFSYDGYLREAHRMYKEVCLICRNFNWPKMSGRDATKPERCPPVADYNEGNSIYKPIFVIRRNCALRLFRG